MTKIDRNFDDISHKFAKNIYGTNKGKIREAIVWQELENILAKYPTNKPLTILDAGGGQGHCPIQDLEQFIETQFDIVICHAVLEWVADPIQIIQSLRQYLKHDGYLSLMFYNYHGLLFKTVTLGNFGYTQAGLNKRKKKTLSPDYPRDPNQVYQWLNQQNFEITNKTGIRIFHDYLTNKSKAETHFEQLLEIEKQFCQTEPYLSLARYILVTAKINNN